MPTIDDLREALVARETYAGDPANVLHGDRVRAPRQRWVLPVAAAALIIVVVTIAVVLGQRPQHSTPPAGPTGVTDTTIAPPSKSAGVLTPGQVEGYAIDRLTTTVTLKADLTNSSATAVAVQYPIELRGLHNARMPLVAATLTKKDTVTNSISSSAPPPPRLTRVGANQTVTLWARIHIECQQLPIQRRWQANLPTILITVDPGASMRLAFNSFTSDSPDLLGGQWTFSGLEQQACAR